MQLRDITKEEFEDVDSMYDANNFTKCEDKLIEFNTLSPHNDEVLWRLARVQWIYSKSINKGQHKHVPLIDFRAGVGREGQAARGCVRASAREEGRLRA